jgi:hypothetical protein
MPAPAAAAASALTGRRIALYGAVSSGAAAAVVVAALHRRPNFYSAAVLLARSNGCMLVLLNWAVFLTLLFGKACQKAFFGPLRAVEIEVSRRGVRGGEACTGATATRWYGLHVDHTAAAGDASARPAGTPLVLLRLADTRLSCESALQRWGHSS